MKKNVKELIAQVQALSMQQHFGINVSDKVKEILTMCENEEDKKTIIKLCNALGLSY